MDPCSSQIIGHCSVYVIQMTSRFNEAEQLAGQKLHIVSEI